MEYVSRVPRPPLDGLIDDLYYLEGAPSPSALLIVNLGAPFRIRAGTAIETADASLIESSCSSRFAKGTRTAGG